MQYTREPDYSAKPGSSSPPKVIESAGVVIPLPREAGAQKPHPRCRPRRYVIGTWITEEAYQRIVTRYRERGGRGKVSLSALVAEIVYRDLGLGASGRPVERPASRAVPVEVKASEVPRGPRRHPHTLAGLRAWFHEHGGDDDMLRDFLDAFARYRLPDGAGLRRGRKHRDVVAYWQAQRGYQSPQQIAKWFGISVRTLRRITRPYRRPKRPSTWSGRPAPASRPMRIRRLA